MINVEDQLELLIKAGCHLIELVSHERVRMEGFLVEVADRLQLPLYRWDECAGLFQWNVEKGYFEVNNKDLNDVIDFINHIIDSGEKGIFLGFDLHFYLPTDRPEPKLVAGLRTISALREQKTILVLGIPIKNIPIELEKEMPIIEVPLPDKDVLHETLSYVLKNLDIEEDSVKDIDSILEAALGLTHTEAELAFSKAAIQLKKLDAKAIEFIIREKEQIIKKKKILEYFDPKFDLKDVGGLDVLKDWLKRRRYHFTQSAQKWGCQVPRGILLLGVPGCGKSLCAKAVGREFNMPLIRFDVGKVYSSLLGQTESNIREALNIAEAIAPCILWLDEIEKGLSGIDSSNETDSGTSARVFGTFLTWMQEKTKPVFVVATANKIQKMPPELLRKGRFDEIFFVDLPTLEERIEILQIILRRVRPQLNLAEKFNLPMLAEKLHNFSGAEIEECIYEALSMAYNKSREKNDDSIELNDDFILAAAKDMSILYDTMFEMIESLREWALNRTKYASSRNLVLQKDHFKGIMKNENPLLLKAEQTHPFVRKKKVEESGEDKK